jgi:hypothetical protein
MRNLQLCTGTDEWEEEKVTAASLTMPAIQAWRRTAQIPRRKKVGSAIWWKSSYDGFEASDILALRLFNLMRLETN